MSMPTDPQNIAERLIVLRAREGDDAAMRVLISRYERRLWFFTRRIVNDDHRAWDIVQEVWIDVFRKLGGLKSPEAFRVWLYQIAHARAVSTVRRERRQESAVATHAKELGDQISDDAGRIDEFLSADRAAEVRAALDHLPEDQRLVLTLRFLEDLPLEEIADALQVPVGTVKSRLFYGKQTLKRLLENAHHGE